MDYHSLEILQEKIFFEKTKQYLTEVISSYNNDNYRSALVMLWSVVVFDLLLKLQNIESIYGDKLAKNILNEIKNKQLNNATSSDWEMYLVEEVCKQTEIIEFSELENLRFLQKQRHLSAHPVIRDDMQLYKPNKDICRALIRNCIENVFVKPPIYTQKVLNNILNDLAENKAILNKLSDIEKFTNKKYLSRLSINARKQIFKSIWKLVFNKNNEDCVENRVVNAKFLCVIAMHNIDVIEQAVNEDKDYYSNISNNEDVLTNLMNMLNRNQYLYNLLNDDIKLRLNASVNTNIFNSFIGYFSFENMDLYYEHLNQIVNEDSHRVDRDIALQTWQRLSEIGDSSELDIKFNNLLGFYYSKSLNYNNADVRFKLISKFFNKFTSVSFSNLLALSENNSQSYNRSGAIEDYYSLKKIIVEKNPDFDFSMYPNFLDKVSQYDEIYNTDTESADSKEVESNIIF